MPIAVNKNINWKRIKIKKKRKINEGSNNIWYYLILMNLFNFYKQDLRALNNSVFFDIINEMALIWFSL